MVGQDEECKLLTVGSWYAMTGYAAAFPRNSKHFSNFNRKIMDYSENGRTKIFTFKTGLGSGIPYQSHYRKLEKTLHG